MKFKEQLNQVVNEIVSRKNISWIWGIKNAKLVVESAFTCETIYEVISNKDINILKFQKKNLEIQLNQWSYIDFVISALLFYIQYESQQINPNWTRFFRRVMALLFDDTQLGKEVFLVLRKTNLFHFFPQQSITAILSFFQSKFIFRDQKILPNVITLEKFLALFHFPYFFKNICIQDCKNQQSSGPLLLALYVYQVTRAKLDSNIGYEETTLAFNSYKNYLLKKGLLSQTFFFKVFFRNTRHFYELNNRIETKEAAILVMAAPIIFSVMIFGAPKISLFSSRNLQPNAIEQRKFYPSELIAPKVQISNTKRKSVYLSATKREPLQRIGSLLPGYSNQIEFLEHSVTAAYNRTYKYSIIKYFGEYYFSPFGIHGRYNNLEYDYKNYILPAAKNEMEKFGVPFKLLGDCEVEIDHVLKKPFRDAFGLDRKQAYAVIVPSILNAERTNTRVVDYALFDFRWKAPWNLDKCKNLSKFVKTRLWESLLWTRQKVSQFEDRNTIYKIILTPLEQGYDKAMALELQSINSNFLIPNKLIRNDDSMLAFLNQMLLEGRRNDLINFQNHMLEYNNIQERNIISKNFAIQQAVAGCIEQIRVAQNLNDLIHSSNYKNKSIKKHSQLTQELEWCVQGIIESNRSKENFDAKAAGAALGNLKKEKKIKVKYSINKLTETCNETLQLGDSYSTNGQVLDLCIMSAQELAKLEKKSKNFYLEKTIIQQEPSLFPSPSTLDEQDYRMLLESQESTYAKKVLKNTSPYNLNSNQEEDNSTFYGLERAYQPFRSSNPEGENEFPDVPRRKTSNEDRLKRLSDTSNNPIEGR